MLMTLVRNFIQSSWRNDFAKNTAILTLGTIAAQGILIIAMPILSRLYTPADFGILAVFMAIAGIVGTAITLRFDAAILIPKDENESVSLVLLSGILAIILGFFIGIILWLLPDPLRAKLGILVLNDWIVLAAFFGATNALINIGLNWCNRKSAYIKITTTRIVQSVTAVVLGIVLSIFGFEGGLMLAQIVASLIVVIMTLVGLQKIQINWQGHDFRRIARKHCACPQYLLPTALLDVVTLQLPILLITAWFNSELAGQFSMAWKMLAIPSALVGAAVGQVFIRQFSETWPDAQAARKLLFQTWKVLALVGFLPLIIVTIFGEELFGWILGDVWKGAGSMAVVLAPMLFAMLISSPTSGTFLVLGMQRYSLFFGISVLTYRPLCIWIGFLNNNLILGLIILTVIELLQISFYQFLAIQRINKV